MKILKNVILAIFLLTILSCGNIMYREIPSSNISIEKSRKIKDPNVTITANYFINHYVDSGMKYLVLDYMVVTDSSFRKKYCEVEYIVIHQWDDYLLRIYSVGPIDTTIKVGSIINFKKVYREQPGYLFYKKLNKVLDRQSSMQRFWTYSTFAVVKKVNE